MMIIITIKFKRPPTKMDSKSHYQSFYKRIFAALAVGMPLSAAGGPGAATECIFRQPSPFGFTPSQYDDPETSGEYWRRVSNDDNGDTYIS